MKPGIYHDIPIEQYHADPDTISKSGLDLIARTPLHYWSAHLDPGDRCRGHCRTARGWCTSSVALSHQTPLRLS